MGKKIKVGKHVWYKKDHPEYKKEEYVGKVSKIKDGRCYFDFKLKESLVGISIRNLTAKSPHKCYTCRFKDKVAQSPECFKCINVKDKLEKFPETKDNWEKFLKNGEWYVNKHKNRKAYIMAQKDLFKCTGFSWSGIWINSFDLRNASKGQTWTLATTKEKNEILFKLKEEAAKRFPKGTTFKTFISNIEFIVEDSGHFMTLKDGNCGGTPKNQWSNKLEGGMSNPLIFNFGIWAEVISKPSLFLGTEPTEIKQVGAHKHVYTLKGSIKKEEWLMMSETIKSIADIDESSISASFKIQGVTQAYTILVESKEDISIGCIQGIALNQINLITKALKENGSK